MSETVAAVSVGRTARAYLELAKANIVMLVLVTGVPALLIAAHGWPEPRIALGATIGIVLAAASAAAFNHYFDRDIDAVMVRTRTRPLPTGVLRPAQALAFAFVLAALSWAVLFTLTNLLAAVVAALSIVYYALFYTVWLKRRTPQNIVIGGGAGATAPLIALYQTRTSRAHAAGVVARNAITKECNDDRRVVELRVPMANDKADDPPMSWFLNDLSQQRPDSLYGLRLTSSYLAACTFPEASLP
jgi:heme O synthase-like polyprenyltransferase